MTICCKRIVFCTSFHQRLKRSSCYEEEDGIWMKSVKVSDQYTNTEWEVTGKYQSVWHSMAPGVRCGATHHLPFSKRWYVEQVINTKVSVDVCVLGHTQAYFWTAGKARTPDTPVWMQQVDLDPAEAFKLCSLLKGCVSTHFWQHKQQNPSPCKWLSYSCHYLGISHQHRGTKTADCVYCGQVHDSSRPTLFVWWKSHQNRKQVCTWQLAQIRHSVLRNADRFWSTVLSMQLFANFSFSWVWLPIS